jgi:hypothetical protein
MADGQDLRPLTDIEQMTPQEAGAALARIEAERNKPTPVTGNPQNAVEAYRLKQAIINDPDAGSKALNGGPITRQLKALDEQIANGSTLDFAMAGVVPENHINVDPGASLQDQVSAIADLRERGHSDEVIAYALDDTKKISLREHLATKRLLATRSADRDWLSRLAAKDPETIREWDLIGMNMMKEVDEALP